MEPEWSRYDDGADAAVFRIKDQVIDPAEPSTVTAVDDVFFFQLTKMHAQCLFLISVYAAK